jgi:hypothetical protein
VTLLEFFGLLVGDPLTDLAAQRLGQKTSAHADATVDPPDREQEPHTLQGLMPGKDMLVDTVDESAIEVEEQRGGMKRLIHDCSLRPARIREAVRLARAHGTARCSEEILAHRASFPQLAMRGTCFARNRVGRYETMGGYSSKPFVTDSKGHFTPPCQVCSR